MTKKIVFLTSDGSLAIVNPIPDCGISIEQIALKDVPKGLPYRIIDESELPEDRTFRGAWEIDPSLLVDGHGADYGYGSKNVVIAWNSDGSPVLEYRPNEPIYPK